MPDTELVENEENAISKKKNENSKRISLKKRQSALQE